MYKKSKLLIYEYFGENVNPTMVFITASILAEILTIFFAFPFDLLKCRLQSMNHVFKYKSIPHALSTEVKTNGFLSLY